MRKKSIAVLSLLSLCVGLSTTAFAGSETEGPYLAEAVKTDKALKAEFERIIQPISQSAPWLANYGTASPASVETISNVSYDVFFGCKPHSCPEEQYVVIYDKAAKKITSGAFIQNSVDQAGIEKSLITWLGNTDPNQAQIIGKYLH